MGLWSSRTALVAACACALLTAGTQIANAPEVSTKEESLVFKAKTNLIMGKVPVVVRDKHDKGGSPPCTRRISSFSIRGSRR